MPVSLTPVKPSSSITSPPKRLSNPPWLAWASACVMAGDGRSTTLSEDFIQMPPKATFESLNEYYATAFHECVHATEHPSRLDWSRKDRDQAYATW